MTGTFEVQTTGTSYGPWTVIMIDDLRIIIAASNVFYKLVFYRRRSPVAI